MNTPDVENCTLSINVSPEQFTFAQQGEDKYGRPSCGQMCGMAGDWEDVNMSRASHRPLSVADIKAKNSNPAYTAQVHVPQAPVKPKKSSSTAVKADSLDEDISASHHEHEHHGKGHKNKKEIHVSVQVEA